ncbi:MAG TPA: hypothetical protein VLU24_10005 [Mycobacterium sp.]|nr:hypothetical protein [Mycobacterium sp.]
MLPGFACGGRSGGDGVAVDENLDRADVAGEVSGLGLGALLRRGAAAARRHGHQIMPDFGAPYRTPAAVAAG